MARLPRLTLPGQPHHVVQRGNDRQAIFRSAADRQLLLDLLAAHAREHSVDIHAYVLMDNHLHLLVTPSTADGIPRLMQAVGRRYVRAFNATHGRSGTLWEGRYRSSPLQAERHLLACMVYMDLNPVRAGLVAHPEEHPWSSHRHYVGLAADRLVVPHPMVWALGNTPFARESAYRERVTAGISPAEQAALTDAAFHGWALGDPAYLADLQKHTSRRLERGTPGRPRRSADSSDRAPVLTASK